MGGLLPVEPFLRGENRSGRPLRRFEATSLFFLRRVADGSGWAAAYRGPVTGFGVSALHLYNRSETGSPAAIFRSFRAPLWAASRLRLGYGADIGFAGGWRPYDALANPYNKLISTRLTAYVRLALGLRLRVAPRWTVHLDGGLTHVSNGNFRRPNAGLNAVALGIGVRYGPTDLPPPPRVVALPYPARNFLSISLFGAAEKRLYATERLSPERKYAGITHGVAGLNLAWERRVSPKSQFGIGGSLLYHSGTRATAGVTDGALDYRPAAFGIYQWRVGLFPSYELIFHRWSAVVRAEYYVLSGDGAREGGRFRQRLGLKYRLSDRVYLAALVNARQFSVADYVEWHVGYLIPGSPRRRGSRPRD